MAAECSFPAPDTTQIQHHHHRGGSGASPKPNQPPTRDPRRAAPGAKLLNRLSWTVPGRAARAGQLVATVLLRRVEGEPEWRQKCSDAGSSLKYLQLPGASKVYSRQACPQGSGRCGTGTLVYHSQNAAKGLTDGIQPILRIPDLLLNFKLQYPRLRLQARPSPRQARLCHRRANKSGLV